MADYSKKALTREEALKLKALGESYDVTPMSIKEAIIAGASSEDGEDSLVQALTNDERLDYYRNSNSGDDGGSSGSDGGYSEAQVTFMLSDQFIETMTQNNLALAPPIYVMGPFVTHFGEEDDSVITQGYTGYLSPTEMLSFGLENTPINLTAVYPTGGVFVIVTSPNIGGMVCFTDESSGNIINIADETTATINGDCILIVDILDNPKQQLNRG